MKKITAIIIIFALLVTSMPLGFAAEKTYNLKSTSKNPWIIQKLAKYPDKLAKEAGIYQSGTLSETGTQKVLYTLFKSTSKKKNLPDFNTVKDWMTITEEATVVHEMNAYYIAPMDNLAWVYGLKVADYKKFAASMKWKWDVVKYDFPSMFYFAIATYCNAASDKELGCLPADLKKITATGVEAGVDGAEGWDAMISARNYFIDWYYQEILQVEDYEMAIFESDEVLLKSMQAAYDYLILRDNASVDTDYRYTFSQAVLMLEDALSNGDIE